MNTEPRGRRPQVFDADDPGFVTTEEPASPRAGRATGSASQDKAPETDAHLDGPPPAAVPAQRRRAGWGSLLFGSLAGLTLLAGGLWFSQFISATLSRNDWLGWLALGLASAAGVAAFALALKEFFGLWRMARLTHLRRDAELALTSRNPAQERRVVTQLKLHLARSRESRWDLQRFREEERHMRDPGALLGLADRILLERPDGEARRVVYESARRVGVITALVPIGFVVVLFVLFENLRMVRRLAAAYGGQPGFLGGLKLAWWIMGHMAATGVIALTDDLWGQFLGQDVLRRVSRKLGEGAFNGAMTARLGVAAIAVCRPLPFIVRKPPRARHIFYEAFPELRPTLVRKLWTKSGKAETATSSA